MAVGGFVDPSVRAVVVVVEAARRVVEQREVVLRLLLVAVVVVGGAVVVVVVVVVECVVASLSVRGTRSRPVTVAGRWSVVAVCSAPCSILSLSLSLASPGGQSKACFSFGRPKVGAFSSQRSCLSSFFLSPRIIISSKKKRSINWSNRHTRHNTQQQKQQPQKRRKTTTTTTRRLGG